MNTYNTPYTYLIGWSNHNMYYYGVRYAKDCKPEELWVSYHTSSKYVKEFRKEFGEPDVIQVRKTFTDADDARDWEDRVILKLKLHLREDFLNKNRSKGILLSSEIIAKIASCPIRAKKISEANKGRPKSDEHKQKLREAALKRDPKTRLHSEETKQKMSEIAKASNPGFTVQATCPNCGKTAQKASISKYHGLNGEKCKW